MVRAGRYRQVATIKGPNKARDAAGQPVDGTATTIASDVPCTKIDIKGDERLRGLGIEAKVDCIVELRHPGGDYTITNDDFVLIDNRKLQIVWIQSDPTLRRTLNLYCVDKM